MTVACTRRTTVIASIAASRTSRPAQFFGNTCTQYFTKITCQTGLLEFIFQSTHSLSLLSLYIVDRLLNSDRSIPFPGSERFRGFTQHQGSLFVPEQVLHALQLPVQVAQPPLQLSQLVQPGHPRSVQVPEHKG